MLAFVWSGEERAAPLPLPMRNIARTMNENNAERGELRDVCLCLTRCAAARRLSPVPAVRFPMPNLFTTGTEQGTEWKCIYYGSDS